MLLIFATILILFAIFSTKTAFHDTGEYITNAKYFAGTHNLDIFVTHSLLYPLIISFFLKEWPSLITIKIINVFWLFLIGAVLLLWLNNKKAFIIFAFSPLVWVISIQTTPILPASFFFLVSFIFYKKPYKYNLILSGIFQGLAFAVYSPMILFSFFFVLIYFWNENLNTIIKFLIAFFIGLLPMIILELYIFNIPFYTLIRYAGNNFVVALGLRPENKLIQTYTNLRVFLIFFVISPLLFKLYKLKFKNYKKEIIFLIIISLIIILRASLLKYFLLISPIIIFLLVKVLNEKDIKWHCIISIFIILFLTWNYFTPNQENLIENDLKKIVNEYDVNYIIAGPFEAPEFATYLWENKPHFVWFQDFETSLNNKTIIRSYDFDFDSKIPLKDRLGITANFKRFGNKTYEDFIIVTKKEFEELNSYNLERCYEVLCVYTQKQKNQ